MGISIEADLKCWLGISFHATWCQYPAGADVACDVVVHVHVSLMVTTFCHLSQHVKKENSQSSHLFITHDIYDIDFLNQRYAL
jgi:hypothetical protein